METTNTDMTHRSMEGLEQCLKALEAEVARQAAVIREQTVALNEHKEAIEGLVTIVKSMNSHLWGI